MNQDENEREEIEALRSELEKAYATIASLSSMLDRSLSTIERLSEGGVAAPPVDLPCPECEPRAEGDRLSYVNVDDVSMMFGCSKPTAAKYMREAGAASIGSKLVAKRSSMVAFAERTGKTVA